MAEDEGLVLGPGAQWSGADELAVAVVDELVGSGRLAPETRALALRQWPDGVLLEMIMVIGQYVMLSLASDVLEFSVEPRCPELPEAWPGPRARR
jgi:hypothetical protein